MALPIKDSYETYLEYLDDIAPKFRPYIIESLNKSRLNFEKEKHKDVDKYLYNPIIDFSKNSGKLHRPLTCIAAYLSCKNGDASDIEPVLWLAATIENFQSAALIHDDIADGGQIRRSAPCMHHVIGEGLAINAGDFGLSSVVGSVLQNLRCSNYSQDKILLIIENLTFMEYMTIEGQAMDLGWAHDGRFDITERDYIVMATKKSAYYSASIPCVLGAICADASSNVIDAFNDFGKNVGLAFQIKDDILNVVEGNAGVKDFRNDITEGKRTLLVCKALELASEKDKSKLIDILQSGTKDAKKLELATDIMQDCGAIDYAKNLARNLSLQAKENICSILDNGCWKDILLDMANWAIERSY